jgi:hypothetical protein
LSSSRQFSVGRNICGAQGLYAQCSPRWNANFSSAQGTRVPLPTTPAGTLPVARAPYAKRPVEVTGRRGSQQLRRFRELRPAWIV